MLRWKGLTACLPLALKALYNAILGAILYILLRVRRLMLIYCTVCKNFPHLE